MTRITVFVLDLIDPPTHGFRVDASRRIGLLKRMGYEIQLVVIARTSEAVFEVTNDGPIAKQQITIGKQGQASLLPVLWSLLKWPWPMACRRLQPDVQARLMAAIEAFAPDMIWLDSLYCAPWAQLAAQRLQLPLYYRSHNIEHHYMRGQWQAEKSPVARFRLWLCLLHLEQVELDVFRHAKHAFDISATDADYWRGRGIDRISWLPPLSVPVSADGPAVPPQEVRWHVGYFGNLNAPNNVEAIEWFIREVLPPLRQQRPDVTVVIAGSNPTSEIVQLCRTVPLLDLVTDPPVMADLYRQTQVLVNPALRGSGVNLKTIDMMASGQPMVVTAIGAAGLPPELVAQVAAPPGAAAFADRILAALAQQAGPDGQRLAQAAQSLNERARQALQAVLPPA